MPTDPRFLDPSGWRPYPLQQATPVNARGLSYDKWLSQQPLVTPAAMKVWLAKYGADAPKVKPGKRK